MVAVSCSELLNVVGRLLPLICTTEFVRKPLPVTATVNVGPPAATEAGLTPVTTGAFCALPGSRTPLPKNEKARESPLAVRRDLQFMKPPVLTNRCYEPRTGRS